ncbi:MAG: glycoside hydrolase family 5 protein [Deltaproteobacteria bacterium]|nr:glycoside hydrolase family 5 protein [Deltaproteobacteria bacterium]
MKRLKRLTPFAGTCSDGAPTSPVNLHNSGSSAISIEKMILRTSKIIIFFFLFFLYHYNSNLAFCSNKHFLSVKNDKIVNETGREVKEVKLRGIQIDFGSIRGDIYSYPGNNKKLENFFDMMLDYVITEDDFRNIRDMGANMIRLSLSTYKDFEHDTNPFTYREKNFKRLDRLIKWAGKYRLYIIMSMRQSPGGHNSTPHSGNKGLNKLWTNREYQRRLIVLWKTIALRYARDPVIAGYDLLNEPDAPDKEVFNKVYREITKGIREVDDKHIIFLEGNLWAKNLDWIQSPLDTNTALSIHFYEPGIYIEGEGTYPSKIRGNIFDQQALRRRLKKRVVPGQLLNRPVWVGEFGAMTKADNYLKYDQDVIHLLEELNLHWTYWNYKNLRGKPDTQAIYYSTPNNKFIRLISKIKKSKRTFSSFTKQNLREALEFLQTVNFSEKHQLKELLTEFYCF